MDGVGLLIVGMVLALLALIVIAKTGDGRFFGAQKQVQVTIGACTGS